MFVVIECKPRPVVQKSVACMVEYLQGKNKLEADFASTNSTNPEVCKVLIEMILESQRKIFLGKLSTKLALKAECITNVVDDDNWMLRDVILTDHSLSEEVLSQKFAEVEESLKKNLASAAEKCDSDPTYAGLFDGFLKIKNETLPALIESYCVTKFVNENNFINVTNLEENPKNIDTVNIDCEAIIETKRTAEEAYVRDSLKDEPKNKVECTVMKHRSEKVFENFLALKVINLIEITAEEKLRNIANLSAKH